MLEYYSRYFIVFKKNCIYKNVYWHLIIFLHVGPFIFNCNVRQITFRYSQKNENSYLKGAHFLACFYILLKFLHLFMIRLCTTKIWLYVSDSVWSLLDCLNNADLEKGAYCTYFCKGRLACRKHAYKFLKTCFLTAV